MIHTFILATASVALTLMLGGCSESSTRTQVTGESTAASVDYDDHEAGDSISDDHSDHDEDSDDVVKLSFEAANAVGIELSQVTMGTMGQSLSLPAEIRFDADRIANVSPKVSGVIGRLYAREGDIVTSGQILALIISRELAGMKAAWLTANSRQNLAAKALAREEKLFTDKITSEADLQTARAGFESTKADADAAENELHAAGVSHAALERIASAADGDNANAYLTAPIAGTVVRRTVTLGETVSAGDAGADPLFTLVDDSVVWADIAIYKQDIARIHIGASVDLKSDAGDVLAQSTVALILPVINEASRTATARVIVDNRDGTLLPGQFVIADISFGTSEPVIRVPKSAVQLVEDKPSVFLPVDEGFAPRAVLTGVKSGGFVEIRSGLKVGETFVSEGAFTLKAQLEKDAFGDGHGH